MSIFYYFGHGINKSYSKAYFWWRLALDQNVRGASENLAVLKKTINPKDLSKIIYKSLIAALAVTGALIASRQVWLQHLPPELVPECGPGLDYMLNVFPFTDAIKMALTGSGECAEVKWRFIGLSIAEWSLIMFAGITIVTILSAHKSKSKTLINNNF